MWSERAHALLSVNRRQWMGAMTSTRNDDDYYYCIAEKCGARKENHLQLMMILFVVVGTCALNVNGSFFHSESPQLLPSGSSSSSSTTIKLKLSECANSINCWGHLLARECVLHTRAHWKWIIHFYCVHFQLHEAGTNCKQHSHLANKCYSNGIDNGSLDPNISLRASNYISCNSKWLHRCWPPRVHLTSHQPLISLAACTNARVENQNDFY